MYMYIHVQVDCIFQGGELKVGGWKVHKVNCIFQASELGYVK